MFRTLAAKLLVGIAPLLAILVGLGTWAVSTLAFLGGRIDVILRENYDSVVAAEGMKEALERMDSAAQFAILGQDDRALRQFRANQAVFRTHLEKEQNNITVEGEQERADRLAALFERYLEQSKVYFALPASPLAKRSDFYFNELYPTFNDLKNTADEILAINQANMKAEDRRAREAAAHSKQVMILALLGSVAVATLIALLLSRSILEPIRAVTRGARALSRGDLDQVVPATTRDELGELAAAFNIMARTIREFRQAGTAQLVRARKTAQATIDSFPDPVVVVDTEGAVERANPAARRLLGVIPSDETSVPWSPPAQLRQPLADVLGGRADGLSAGLEHAIPFREEGQERYFLPRVLPIRGEQDELLGAAVVLSDVTRFRLIDQLKSDMVATVSHELKTPLTGIQMAVHLLLEEAVGPLNPKQVELMLAARQDSERLLAMVNDLLDLTRIEQGRLKLQLQPAAPADLIAEAVERFEPRARDQGVVLKGTVAFGLPAVPVDRERIEHVFDNLVTNALAHTERGGSIELAAERDDQGVRFAVKDTGTGIPAEYLPQVFEKFFRLPGSRPGEGAGLGLAIAREIVTAHGGQIDVASQLGQGTRFTFTVPLDPIGDRNAALEAARA